MGYRYYRITPKAYGGMVALAWWGVDSLEAVYFKVDDGTTDVVAGWLVVKTGTGTIIEAITISSRDFIVLNTMWAKTLPENLISRGVQVSRDGSRYSRLWLDI